MSCGEGKYNINNGVCAYDGTITMNDGVHVGFVLAIEDATKDGDPSQSVLKRKYIKKKDSKLRSNNWRKWLDARRYQLCHDECK